MVERWLEIKAEGPQRSRDIAAALLIEAGSPGVAEDDGCTGAGRLVSVSSWEDDGAAERPVEPGAKSAMTGYLPTGAEEVAARLKDELEKIGWSLSITPFKDSGDWTERWKRGVRPVRVSFNGVSVMVRPTWSKAARRPGEKLVEIDPGMAFGTGGHETTKMCLRAIVRLLRDGRRKGLKDALLDVGTGSGVLAIATMKLGVRKVVGTEIDPVALKVARKNARANGAKVTLSAQTPAKVRGRFPMVVANILAPELTRLAPELAAKVAEGGFLILSGILSEEAEAVEGTYAALGLKLLKRYSAGDWAALVLERPACKI